MLPKILTANHKDLTESPPTYCRADESERFGIREFEAWDQMLPKNWLSSAIKSNLILKLRPKRNLKQILGISNEPNWHAIMRIKARNIPKLMRSGFNVSSINILPGWSSLKLSDTFWPDSVDCTPLWRHRRIYMLREVGYDPQWHASLTVIAKRRSTLIDFDFRWVTIDTVDTVKGFNWNMGQVYFSSRSNPSANFNLIFPQLELKGWWCWSKPTPTPTLLPNNHLSHPREEDPDNSKEHKVASST